MRRPRRWSLRARLIAVLATLLALVCTIVGVITVLALRGFLIDQLDSQLAAASSRSMNGPPGQGPGQNQDFPPGQASGTLIAHLRNGVVVDAQILDNRGNSQPLDPDDAATLATLPVDGGPASRTIPGYGDYRLLATSIPSGDTLVTGLPLADVNRVVNRLILVEVGVAVVALVASIVVGVLVVRRSLRPLERVASTAHRVSALPLDRGDVAVADRVDSADVDDRTEVGQVGGALNRLLDVVSSALTARHESEMRVRRFVADASHELRTPLAAIRGYAELTRRSHEAIPPDVGYALGRIESESNRMSTMVDDLLLLARLDEGRPLEFGPVDLTHLLLDAVSDASAAGRDHHWRTDLPDEPVEAPGDEAALHQVVANLLANARTHTPPGTTITTGLAITTPGTAVISVLDDGPGIPADVLPTIFERFARGGGDGRPAGSTGLGLAIVHAIVAAHGGSVHVTSRPGQTALLVRLPTRAAPVP